MFLHGRGSRIEGGRQGERIVVAAPPPTKRPIPQFSPPVHDGVGHGACDRLVHAVSPDAHPTPPNSLLRPLLGWPPRTRLDTLVTRDAPFNVSVRHGAELIKLPINNSRDRPSPFRGGVDTVERRRVDAVHVVQLVLPHVLELAGAARLQSVAPSFAGAALVAGGT